MKGGLDVKACRFAGVIMGLVIVKSTDNTAVATVTKAALTAALAGKSMIVPMKLVAAASGVAGTVGGGASAAQAMGSVVTILTVAGASPALLHVAGLFGLVTLVSVGVCYVKSKMTGEAREGVPEDFHDQNIRESDVPLQVSVNSSTAFFESNPVRGTLVGSFVMTQRVTS